MRWFKSWLVNLIKAVVYLNKALLSPSFWEGYVRGVGWLAMIQVTPDLQSGSFWKDEGLPFTSGDMFSFLQHSWTWKLSAFEGELLSILVSKMADTSTYFHWTMMVWRKWSEDKGCFFSLSILCTKICQKFTWAYMSSFELIPPPPPKKKAWMSECHKKKAKPVFSIGKISWILEACS